MRMRSAVLALVAALTLGACSDSPPAGVPVEHPGPFTTCEVQPATPAPGGAGTARVPAVELPCFAGGAPVALHALGRPAVITLWASYCWPCRTELPAFQRLWRKAGSEVVVLGVVTKDTRMAAGSLAEELAVTFPSVYDRQAVFQRQLGRSTLPVTLFVDAAGAIRHTDFAGALDDAELARLVRDKLGVDLA